MAYSGKLSTTVEGTGAHDLFTALISFLTDTPAAAGRDWSIVEDWRPGEDKVVLSNTGISGLESVFIGLAAPVHADGVHAGLVGKVYKHYDAAMDFYDELLGNPDGDGDRKAMTPIWDGIQDFWIFSNKQRVLVVTKVQNRYSNLYAGFFNRFALPSEYPYPLILMGDGYLTETWSSYIGHESEDTNRRCLLFPGTSGNYGANRLYTPAGWVGDWAMCPTQTDTDYWLQVHYKPGESRALLPVYVIHEGQTYGQLDNVMWAPASYNNAESVITVGGDDWILFPDIMRTAWSSFYAVKME